MTPDRWHLIKEKFAAATALDAAAVAGFLDESCAGDPELRADLESLLVAHHTEDAIVDRPAAQRVPAEFAQAEEDRWLGRRVGAYEITALIGHGGMGAVYRARRVDAEFEKEVAIKLVSGGFHASHVLQRFRAERQILAGLEHPHIARLIDGGATADGAPYLVMELVDGEALDRYAAARALRLRERLKLFLDVCGAVSYAHQRLVVHRDLKPGNILVTAGGVVKLLDFGIARILQPAGTEATAAPTMTLMRTLTPGFSSPEQILGKPVTTASDVYSLGVVLYVLLTGRGPYRRAPQSAEDAIREVCGAEPLRPSLAVAQSQPAGHEPLGRDLDAIILQALRKEPERRYASVEQFADDVRRFLDARPVRARGDEFSYLAGKFIRRRRVEVTAAALLLATLVAATSISVREARIADEQRARAERHFASVRGLANAFVFDINTAIEDLPGATRARELLVTNALKYLNSLADEAGEDEDLRLELASAYEKVGDIQGRPYGASKGDTVAALESYAAAIALLEPIVAADPGDARAVAALARASVARSRLVLLQGKPTEALAASQRALERLEPLVAAQPTVANRILLASALDAHVMSLFYGVDPDRQRVTYARRSIELLEALVREHPHDMALATSLSASYSTLATALDGPKPDQAAMTEAEALYRKALDLSERLVAETGGRNADYLRRLFADRSNFSQQLAASGDMRGALEMLRSARRLIAERAADPNDVQVRFDLALGAWHEGRYLRELGQWEEAESILTDNVSTVRGLETRAENLQLVFVRAASETQLGLIESARGSRPGIDPEARLAHWQRARAWFASAVPAFERVTSVATLSNLDMAPVNAARDGLARADAEIAKLTAGTPTG